jgi:RNA polymerase sigma factor (TIGR02999 family)
VRKGPFKWLKISVLAWCPEIHAMPGESTGPAEITQLLHAAGGGDSRAAAELLPLVYEELRNLARARMAREPGGGLGQTLQPTALVHEAYLRLVGAADIQWNGRGHFFGAAAQAMRRILVDRARERGAQKRGGGRVLETDPQAIVESEELNREEVLALDEALDRLAAIGKRRAEVVMLRCFAGLGIEETSLALGVSTATVKNEWKFARAWLRREVAQKIGVGEP